MLISGDSGWCPGDVNFVLKTIPMSDVPGDRDLDLRVCGII